MSSIDRGGPPDAVVFGVPLLSGGILCAFAPVATIAAISPMKRVSDGSVGGYDYDELIPEAVGPLIG